jgi:hypothetical protein
VWPVSCTPKKQFPAQVQVQRSAFDRLGFGEVYMGWSEVGNTARFAAVLFCAVTLVGRATAQSSHVAGEYVCAEAHVAGKAVPCKAAPLNLKSDGKFELQGREGEYLVSGNWVELNGSVLKSRAKIEAGYKIVFRFYNKKGLCEMIYERRVAEMGKIKLS